MYVNYKPVCISLQKHYLWASETTGCENLWARLYINRLLTPALHRTCLQSCLCAPKPKPMEESGHDSCMQYLRHAVPAAKMQTERLQDQSPLWLWNVKEKYVPPHPTPLKMSSESILCAPQRLAFMTATSEIRRNYNTLLCQIKCYLLGHKLQWVSVTSLHMCGKKTLLL